MPKRAVQNTAPADAAGSFATAARDASTAGNVIAIANDGATLELLRSAVKDRHRLWRAESADRAVELLFAAPSSVLLIDVAVTQNDTAGVVRQLKEQFPGIPVIVTGRRDDETALSALISSGAVFRFLHKPLSEERARTFVENAVRRLGDQPPSPRPGAPQESPPPATPPEPYAPRAGSAPAWPQLGRRGVIAILGAVLLIAAAVALLRIAPWEAREDSPPEASVAAGTDDATLPTDAGTAATPRPAGADDPEVARLLDEASLAISEGRYAEPQGANAIESYRAVLARDPANAAARRGLSQAADLLLVEVEFALLDGNLSGAATSLDAARAANPQHPRLEQFSAKLAAERARLVAPNRPSTAADVPLPTRPQRSAAGKGDRQAQFDRAMASAREAIAQRQFVQAEGWVARAAETGVDPTAAERLQAELDAARAAAGREERTRLLALANQRIAQGRLVEPDADSARHYVDLLRASDPSFQGLADTAALLGERMIAEARRLTAEGRKPEAERLLAAAASYAPTQALGAADAARTVPLVRRVYVPPVYPARAATRGTEGWVEVEFTIGRDGQPRALRVANASPQGVFDEAALAAVAAWRYEPPADGERLVVQRLRFELGRR